MVDANLVECEEEGPIAYITTWYLHHKHHHECRTSRSARLQLPSATWGVWQDHIIGNEAILLRLVRPTPPCGDLECNQAQVIIEQGLPTTRVPFLISTVQGDVSRFGHATITHPAHSEPALQSSLSIVRMAQVQTIALTDVCRVYWRQLPFALLDLEAVLPGANLMIRVAPGGHDFHDLSDDEISLFQVMSTPD